MARRIIIQFPADRPYDYYAFRVLNFSESLWHPIVNSGLGKLNDHARKVIYVDVVATRHLGTVKGIITKALQKHSLTGDATIVIE